MDNVIKSLYFFFLVLNKILKKTTRMSQIFKFLIFKFFYKYFFF
ncbi:unnamed protein product [Brassica napus]|uniref:(rape) hypothetical protein n=1 Tax=Brassica napus TaxID=3708 RepID=A0A816KNA9_BRANA|nr:unnamed protein product [Brassica napus]